MEESLAATVSGGNNRLCAVTPSQPAAVALDVQSCIPHQGRSGTLGMI